MSVHFMRLLNYCPQLRFVDLTNCLWVTDLMLTTLINNTKLEGFCIHGCGNIRGMELHLLTENLPHLQYLNVAHCTLQQLFDKSPTPSSSAESPPSLPPPLPLKHVIMAGTLLVGTTANEAVQTIFRRCHNTLERLTLDWTQPLDDSAFEVLRSIPPMRNLVELSFANCQGGLTDNALRIMAEGGHGANLRTLSLMGCCMLTGRGVAEFVSRAGCTGLKTLDASYLDGVTDDVVGVIAEYCPSLENLRLRGCVHMTDVGLARLAEAQHSHAASGGVSDGSVVESRLRRLALDWNHNITSSAVMELVRRCGRLEYLSLTGCEQICGAGNGGGSRVQQLALSLNHQLSTREVVFENVGVLRDVFFPDSS
ncbi:hypothetical protein HK102_011355 [Quaeritorhiza haematococci]|nr:hypothetical protein HK102_011355 [Quaeritorhiza haematococci]